MEVTMAYGKGYLTTHILDTAKGCPAQGVRIELYKLRGGERQLMKTVISDDDGRTDEPIIAKGSLEVGVYELEFAIGMYFNGATNPHSVPFIDIVPIRFGIGDADQHYHVPLLASPFFYSTYRGS